MMFDLDEFLSKFENIPYDEKDSDFSTKEIGDRVVPMDLDFISGMDSHIYDRDKVVDVEYFIIADKNIQHKLAVSGRIATLDLIIVNPISKLKYRTTSYKVKLYN